MVGSGWHDGAVLGEQEEADAWLNESLSLARAIPYPTGTGVALWSLGGLAYDRGEFDRSRVLATESVSVLREVGDSYTAAIVLVHLSEITLFDGDLPLARPSAKESWTFPSVCETGCTLVVRLCSWLYCPCGRRRQDRACAI